MLDFSGVKTAALKQELSRRNRQAATLTVTASFKAMMASLAAAQKGAEAVSAELKKAGAESSSGHAMVSKEGIVVYWELTGAPSVDAEKAILDVAKRGAISADLEQGDELRVVYRWDIGT